MYTFFLLSDHLFIYLFDYRLWFYQCSSLLILLWIITSYPKFSPGQIVLFTLVGQTGLFLLKCHIFLYVHWCLLCSRQERKHPCWFCEWRAVTDSTQVPVLIFGLHKKWKQDFRFIGNFFAILVMQLSLWYKKGSASRIREESFTFVSNNIFFMSWSTNTDLTEVYVCVCVHKLSLMSVGHFKNGY